jgi:prolyl 4-hydroxylase
MSSENQNVQIEVSERPQKNMIHEDPEIYTIDNFLTEEECQHFIDISKDKFKRSIVADDKGGKGKISDGRTSNNTWIKHDHDSITFAIGSKIANIVNIPLENAESFQVVHYDEKQEYRQHYDGWKHDYSPKALKNMEKGGQRMKTALVYLNTVEEGGGTKMTKLNKTINAEQGKLLVFNNTYKDSHERHLLSEHAGTPVLKGEKYIFNLWFRECGRWSLYRDFNPKYYEKINNILPPAPSTEQKYEKIINLDGNPQVSRCTRQKQALIHTQFSLEEGDYIPFVNIKFESGNKKELYNYVDNNEFLIIHVKNIETIANINKIPNFNTIAIFKSGTASPDLRPISTKDTVLYGLFKETDHINVYLTTPNRKIYKVLQFDSVEDFNKEKIEKSLIQPKNIPYLLIDNVFNPQLLEKVIKYYDNNSNRHTPHYTATKNRLHIHPDKELEIEIDNKLSRSVFPEIRKIFYFDVHYRESYKICYYDSKTGGRFHPHRDTPAPYQHRRYAMSLFLNDDYEGGEFELPEYNFKIKPKANSALIFPGISSHKVNEVTKGARRVIITFYCSELDGKTKNNCNYTVKSHFYEQHGVKYGPIFPV